MEERVRKDDRAQRTGPSPARNPARLPTSPESGKFSEKQMDPTLWRENPKTIASKNTPEEIPRRIQHDFRPPRRALNSARSTWA